MLFKKKIISNVLGNLKYIKKYDQYNGTAYINFLKRSCNIVVCGNNIEYAEKCINYLNKDMPAKVCNNIFKSLLKYCCYYLDNYDDINIPRDLNESDILQYIRDISIIISEPKLNTIGFVIVGNCEWEEEHGFCVVVENEKVKYAGEHDNNFDPWGNNYDAGFAK